MDRLDDLPEKQDTVPTPQETQILSQLFGAQEPVEAAGSGGTMSRFSSMNWKMIGGAVLAFAVLANPWIDSAICKIPYCTNPTAAFAVKVLLFLLILIVLHLFL